MNEQFNQTEFIAAGRDIPRVSGPSSLRVDRSVDHLRRWRQRTSWW